tara:strand:+ start:644 stop:1759 length:1116 start_codon:yes stop_codon:yes gene_type:complete
METYLPTRIFFKDGNLIQKSSFLNDNEKTFLIISNSIRGIYPNIINDINPSSVYSSIGSNPSLKELQEIKIPKGITQVVGIGGGSKLDAAKAIFARIITKDRFSLIKMIKNTNLIDDYINQRHLYKLILIPTTFGTSSEITKWGTIWDLDAKKKYSISHDILYSDIALIFPELGLTASHNVTAFTGLDTFSHALESLWNKSRNFYTVNLALKSIEMCLENLPLVLKNLKSKHYRKLMAQTTIFAGMAFSQTKTAAAHALSYPLTIHHNIPHGYACSLTLGAMFDYNLSKQPELKIVLELIQRKYGSKNSTFSECFQKFLEACNIKSRLRNYGLNSNDIPKLVKESFHPERFNNMSHTLSEKEVEKIFQQVL